MQRSRKSIACATRGLYGNASLSHRPSIHGCHDRMCVAIGSVGRDSFCCRQLLLVLRLMSSSWIASRGGMAAVGLAKVPVLRINACVWYCMHSCAHSDTSLCCNVSQLWVKVFTPTPLSAAAFRSSGSKCSLPHLSLLQRFAALGQSARTQRAPSSASASLSSCRRGKCACEQCPAREYFVGE